MHASWKVRLADEFTKTYFYVLRNFVREERQNHTVFPDSKDTFNAFEVTPFEEAKVVILGQDPYHGYGQAHGLSFSVRPGIGIPPSLRNIYRELESDLGVKPASHGHLLHWAKQGVFLLNSTLTVQEGKPGSHHGYGWERFTDQAIRLLNERTSPAVFVLWGKTAGEARRLISNAWHTVIESAHPSPMSARSGFFGSRPFSRANKALEECDLAPIDWQLPPV